MESGLEPSDLFPPMSQGLIMWTRHEGQRELGIGSEQVVTQSTQPLQASCSKEAVMSLGGEVGEELVTLCGHSYTQVGKKAKPERWGFPGR